MKKYRLKKDLPGIPAGAIYSENDNLLIAKEYNSSSKSFFVSDIESYWFDDWFEEVKEEPGVWWEEGKPYRHIKAGYLYGVIFKNINGIWNYEVNNTFLDSKKNESFFKKEYFEEYIPSPKAIRKWPALIKNLYGYKQQITLEVFQTEKEAKIFHNSTFIKWPANENFYVDVPIEDEKCNSKNLDKK